MVQTVRRPSQVVLLPLAASATAATKKTSVVYRVPIQLEWDKVRTKKVFSAQKFESPIFTKLIVCKQNANTRPHFTT